MSNRTKRCISALVGALAFLAVLCIVGTMEAGRCLVIRAALLAAFCELLGAAALWKAGLIRR